MDGGDIGFAGFSDGHQHRFVLGLDLLVDVLIAGQAFGEVGAGGKAFALSADNDNANALVVFCVGDDFFQLLAHLLADGVPCLGAIESDGGHTVFDGVGNGFEVTHL